MTAAKKLSAEEVREIASALADELELRQKQRRSFARPERHIVPSETDLAEARRLMRKHGLRPKR